MAISIDEKLEKIKVNMAKVESVMADFAKMTEANQEKNLDFLAEQIGLAVQLNKSYEGLGKRVDKLKEAKDEADDADKAGFQGRIDRLKETKDKIDEQRTGIDLLANSQGTLGAAMDKLIRKNMSYKRYVKLSTAGQEDFNKTMLEGGNLQEITTTATEIAGGVFEGFGITIRGLTAEMAAMATFMKGVNFTVFYNAVASGAALYDKSFRKIMKTGITFQENMDAIFRASMTPAAAFKEYPEMRKVAGDMLTAVGIKSDEVSASFIALKKNAMIFTPDFIKRNIAFTTQLTNLNAGLKKLGVGYETSAKSFDIFTKVLKQAPKEAMNSSKKLITIAKSLDITTGKAFEDFNKLMPTLAMFGERAIEVFGRLEAQSRATGVQMGTLSKIAQGLDTFKGAAKAAQGLNAVLGGTFISVTDLVHADFPEKIELIRKAFERSGRTFATSHKRIKQIVAAQLGTDVGTAARIFGSESEYKSVTESLDMSAMSTEELMVKMAKQMTSAEHLKKGIQNLAGGFSKLVKISRRVAKEASNTLIRTFAGIEAKVSGSDKALVGFLGHLKLMAGITKVRGKILGLSVATSIFSQMDEKQLEVLGEQGIHAAEDIMDMTMKGLNVILKQGGAAIMDIITGDAGKANKAKADRALAGTRKGASDAKGVDGLADNALATALDSLRKTPIKIDLRVLVDEKEIAQISKNATIDVLAGTMTLDA